MIGRYRCRCRFCARRRTLRRHPDEYIRLPKCGCGRERRALRAARREGRPRPPSWRVDRYRNDGREQHGKNCRCDGYSFVHTHGRGWCEGNTRITVGDLQRRHEEGIWA